MRDDACSCIDFYCRIVGCSCNKRNHELKNKEKQWNDYSYFGSWEENLNEEVLYYENDIKEYEYYKDHVKFYVF